jgi:hypothetical protein
VIRSYISLLAAAPDESGGIVMDDHAARTASDYGQRLKELWDNIRDREDQALTQANVIVEPIREFLSALEAHTRRATDNPDDSITLGQPSVHLVQDLAEVTYPVTLATEVGGKETSFELRVIGLVIDLNGKRFELPAQAASLNDELAELALAFFKPRAGL